MTPAITLRTVVGVMYLKNRRKREAYMVNGGQHLTIIVEMDDRMVMNRVPEIKVAWGLLGYSKVEKTVPWCIECNAEGQNGRCLATIFCNLSLAESVILAGVGRARDACGKLYLEGMRPFGEMHPLNSIQITQKNAQKMASGEAMGARAVGMPRAMQKGNAKGRSQLRIAQDGSKG